ncbi:hypothetical protein PM10SUCC1_19380 [Propionigenium maris DSM 9537]|uniref:SEC-C motif-containing protein n=1 Tax=Propionigenium maris DSM 9537 TaxID=1123000 RepID=A0A9W6GJQ9_9FUSO|nr:SEC-C domain-containing protein [Propionigenium maris]GLI56424.1 hypothetical protein PM10SUCC1_19380 [Propionigenium maris DSM 9537]
MVALEEIKRGIKNKNEEKVVEGLKNLIKEEPKNIKKAVLMRNTIIEPLNRKCNKEDNDFFIRAIIKVIAEEIKEDNVKSLAYLRELLEIMNSINTIFKSVELNNERLKDNKFKNHTFLQKIHSFMAFFESQRLYMSKEKVVEEGEFVTGMEKEVAKYAVEGREIVVPDRGHLEGLIESGEALYNLCFYEHKDSIEEEFDKSNDWISPYMNPGFEEIMHLAHHRKLLEDIWSRFKYADWKLESKEEVEKFYPNNKKIEAMKHVATHRYTYRVNSIGNNIIKEKEREMREAYTKIVKSSDNITMGLLDNLFRITKEEYLELNYFINELSRASKELLAPIYFDTSISEIKIEEYILGCEYLQTLALIYQEAEKNKFIETENNQNLLVPLVSLDKLIGHFSNVHDIELKKAKQIIETYVFGKDLKLDLFSQPLPYVGGNNVIFSTNLILQLNIFRMIEMLVNKVSSEDVAKKGIQFEKEIREALSLNPHINVNKDALKYEAFDGREIEYDFIGTFEDCLILMEFKHLKVPYTDKERYNSFETLKEAFEQIKRRSESVEKDWEKIKELSTLDLPEKPFKEEKIIKIVCTNIYEFTTLEEDNIKVIDSTSLLCYFVKKNTEVFASDDSVYKRLSLCKKSKPTVKEFLEFLENPITIEPFKKAFSEQLRPIQIMGKEDNIAIYELILKKDPYKEYIKKILEDPKKIKKEPEKIKKKKKLGRNEKCFCGSGKKYKKCCLN